MKLRVLYSNFKKLMLKRKNYGNWERLVVLVYGLYLILGRCFE
jgi:hypothetical protein